MMAAAESGAASARRWYVVQAYSGFEQQVKKMIAERVSLHGMQDRFGRILVPTEEVVEMRAGQKRRSSRKFFPGYVLVEMEMDDDLWHLVRSTPKVLGFIGGSNNSPTPISDSDVEDILHRMEEGDGKPKPKFVYEPGEVVRVTDGVFKDFNGVLEEVDYEKNRLKVSVLIFGRSTPLELSFDQVEKE